MTGRAWEANRMIFPDALAGDYKQSNLVWNGKSREISLRAAHNEIVSFQVVVERPGDDLLKNVNVTVGPLIGPGGATIPAANVDLFKEWYVHVDRRSAQDYSLGTGWYPDALIPCTHWTGKLFPRSFILPFSVPDQLNNIGPEQRNQTMWMDIYVPRDSEKFPSGTYRSQVIVSAPSGRATLNLSLAVWNFALPDENHVGGDIHTDTELHTFAPELELKYYQLVRKHRLVMGEIGYVPDIHIEGTKVQIDWAGYDNRLSKYLDGSAFTEKYGYNGPGYGLPIELLMLPFDAYPTNDYYNSRHVGWPYGKEWKFYRPWPIEIPDTGITPEYTAIWKNTFRAFQKHIEDHPGWDCVGSA